MYNYVSISFLLFEDGTSCNVLPYFVVVVVVVVAIVVFVSSSRGCTSGGVYVPCIYTHGR